MTALSCNIRHTASFSWFPRHCSPTDSNQLTGRAGNTNLFLFDLPDALCFRLVTYLDTDKCMPKPPWPEVECRGTHTAGRSISPLTGLESLDEPRTHLLHTGGLWPVAPRQD